MGYARVYGDSLSFHSFKNVLAEGVHIYIERGGGEGGNAVAETGE